MPFKTPKNTAFVASTDAAQITLTSIESGDDIVVSAQYGLIVDQITSETVGHRFVLSREETIMGKVIELSAGAVDVSKAVDAFITQEMRQDPDEYDVEGTDDEYFAQKFVKPKVEKADIWKSEAFAEIREELSAARDEVEGALISARDSEVTTQEDYLKFSQMLVATKAKIEAVVGATSVNKAMASWANGGSEGGNDAHPLLSQLGSGTNALREAMYLAQLTVAEYNVLPAGITSGKGVARHGSVSVKEVVNEAHMNKLAKGTVVLGDSKTDMISCAAILRHIAEHSFGVQSATDQDFIGLTELPAAIDAVAGQRAAEFIQKYGKNINSYDKTEFEAAKRAFGYVRVSSAGTGIFQHAVDVIVADSQLADDAPSGDRDALTGALFSKTGGNMLLKEALKAANDHAASVAQSQADTDANKAATAAVAAGNDSDNKNAVFSKSARSAFGSLSAGAAAAELFSLIHGHAEADDVKAALVILMNASVSVTPVKVAATVD